MQTQTRLTEAFDAARLIPIDAATKMVFFSDQHRGDGSRADEFAKNRVIFVHALQHYYAGGFTLAELGDSEDLWEFPHVRHIVKANGAVYQLLRRFHESGRYLRLYGNHDAQLADPRYVEQNLARAPHPITGDLAPLLPDLDVEQALRLQHRETGQEFVVVHGHQGDFSNDQNWRFTMLTFRVFWRWLHAFGIASPASPIRNSFKRHKVERNYVKWLRSAQVGLICGHTHRIRFARVDEAPYFNTGSCTFNGYITCLELADDALTLVAWEITPDAEGYLRVGRRVIAGPRAIEAYDRRRFPGLTAQAEKARFAATRAQSKRVPARKGGPKQTRAAASGRVSR